MTEDVVVVSASHPTAANRTVSKYWLGPAGGVRMCDVRQENREKLQYKYKPKIRAGISGVPVEARSIGGRD